jgi:hypothetical protein
MWAPRLTAGSLSWSSLTDLNTGVINGTAEVQDPVERDLALVWQQEGSVTADLEFVWQVDAGAVEFLNGSLVISGQDVGISIPQTEITGGGGFVRVPPKSRKKLKEWLEQQKITDVPLEAGAISISGCEIDVELTDIRPVYEFNPDLAKPPIKFGSKPTIAKELEAVIVQVDFEAERLAAKKRKRRRQEEELLLFM